MIAALFERVASRLPPRSRRLLPAFLALAMSAELFAYAGAGAVDRAGAARALALAERVRADSAALSRRLHEMNAGAAGAKVPDRTEFLKQVGAAATQAGVRVTRLTPRATDPALLDVELDAGFPGFLRFTAAVERLRSALHGVQLRQADGGATGRLLASFALEAPRLQAPAVSAPTAEPAPRDPFAPSATLPATASATAASDPSGLHRLTGITRVGGALMATIDGRDYQEGDALGDATIAAIGDDEVRLAAGSRGYRLGFVAPPR